MFILTLFILMDLINGEDILSDAIEAFKILKVNGLMFFDDFLQHDDNRIFTIIRRY